MLAEMRREGRLILVCAEAGLAGATDEAIASTVETTLWAFEPALSPHAELFSTIIDRLRRSSGGPMPHDGGVDDG